MTCILDVAVAIISGGVVLVSIFKGKFVYVFESFRFFVFVIVVAAVAAFTIDTQTNYSKIVCLVDYDFIVFVSFCSCDLFSSIVCGCDDSVFGFSCGASVIVKWWRSHVVSIEQCSIASMSKIVVVYCVDRNDLRVTRVENDLSFLHTYCLYFAGVDCCCAIVV